MLGLYTFFAKTSFRSSPRSLEYRARVCAFIEYHDFFYPVSPSATHPADWSKKNRILQLPVAPSSRITTGCSCWWTLREDRRGLHSPVNARDPVARGSSECECRLREIVRLGARSCCLQNKIPCCDAHRSQTL